MVSDQASSSKGMKQIALIIIHVGIFHFSFITSDVSDKPTCNLCRKKLSTEASLKQHQDKYCRYREGKKAKSSVVPLHRMIVNINDGEIEFWGGR